MRTARNTNAQNAPIATQVLLFLQLVGTHSIGVFAELTAPGSWARRLPLVRIAAVATGLALVCQDELSFQIEVPAAAVARAQFDDAEPGEVEVAQAGFFSNWFRAAEPANTFDDAAALAYIERFEHIALAEQERFGLDAGVLLAAAIASNGAGQQPVGNNVFGAALDGPFESTWASWRAMSLSVLATTNGELPLTRAARVQAVATLYPDAQRAQRDIAFVLERFDL